MTRRARILLPVLFVGTLVLLSGAVLRAQASRQRVIDEIIASIRRDDAAALAERVDWAALRPALKEIVIEQTATKIGLRGGINAPPGGYANVLVNHYARPEAIAALLQDLHHYAPDGDPARFIHSAHMMGLTGFSVELADPELSHGPKVHAFFGLHDGRWALDGIKIPASLLPSLPIVQG